MHAVYVATLLCSVAAAQVPPTLAEQAWTAHRIAQSREPGRESTLIPLAQSPDQRVQNAALDALIQTGARLDSDELARLSDEFPAQRLILAGLAGKDGIPAVWEFARSGRTLDHWVTALNLLLAQSAAGLARHLLAEWTISATLVVTDTDSPIGIAGSGGGGAGDGGIYRPEGFPPPVYYHVTITGLPGDTLLARGPYPSYYRRTTTRGFYETFFDRDYLRHRYLAELLHWPPQLLSPESGSFTQHVWRSLTAFNEAVQQLTETRQRQYGELIHLLRERNLLPDDELTGLSTKLVLKFTDSRQTQAPPLPPPPAVTLQPKP